MYEMLYSFYWGFIGHGMMSLEFQTAVEKNEAKLNYFVQFETEWRSITEQSINSLF